MQYKYICRNPNHPASKHSNIYEYDHIPTDSFCPDCDWGTALLEEVIIDPAPPDSPKQPSEAKGSDELVPYSERGVAIIVCDVSYTMTEDAFPNVPGKRFGFVAKAAARGIADLYSSASYRRISQPRKAYVGVVAFARYAKLISAPDGSPFLKSVEEIQSLFPAAKDLGDFLAGALNPVNNEDIDPKRTDISHALEFAYDIHRCAREGDLRKYGVPGVAGVMTHDVITFDGHPITVPNIRTLLYSDGQRNPHPEDAQSRRNPFAADDPSSLMTVFFGPDDHEGARELRSDACKCPMHGETGFFLIDGPDKYPLLRGIFGMTSGTSGFCMTCAERLGYVELRG